MSPNNTDYPKYLCVTLDRTRSYKEHIQNTRINVAIRKNLPRKRPNSKWETNASGIRTRALAYDIQSPNMRCQHGRDQNMHTYRAISSTKYAGAITGFLKPTNVEDLYLLAGIAPPDVRRGVCAQLESVKQVNDEAHSLFVHIHATNPLKSRSCFLYPQSNRLQFQGHKMQLMANETRK